MWLGSTDLTKCAILSIQACTCASASTRRTSKLGYPKTLPYPTLLHVTMFSKQRRVGWHVQSCLPSVSMHIGLAESSDMCA